MRQKQDFTTGRLVKPMLWRRRSRRRRALRQGPDAILTPAYPTITSMKLIGSLTSPYVRKVRVVLAEKKLDYSFDLEDVWAADTRIHLSNPLGKVPCLIMEDGSAMYDSRVIVEYLDTLTPVGKLLPPNGRERADVKVWEALGDGVLDAALLVRLEKTLRPAEQQSPAWIERQMGKVHAGLSLMSDNLGESPFCKGNHYTLADVAVGCALGYLQFRFPEIGWRGDYPNLARLFDKLSERASFKDTVPQ
jgi:glutathione S-transferase